MITGAVLIVIGTWLGLYLRAHRVIDYPDMQPLARKKLGDGDPPVTVSDGSFNGTSPYSWQNPGDTILAPQGETATYGTLVKKCGNMPAPGLVDFYDGKNTPVDISPTNGKLNLTIFHGGGGQTIIALTNSNLTNLTFIDLNSGWGPPSSYANNYKSENGGASDSIYAVQYVDSSGKTVVLKSAAHGAYVGFCYK